MRDFRFLSISHTVNTNFKKPCKTTDTDEAINPHFGSDLQTSGSIWIWIQIRIIPETRIQIPANFQLTFRPWLRFHTLRALVYTVSFALIHPTAKQCYAFPQQWSSFGWITFLCHLSLTLVSQGTASKRAKHRSSAIPHIMYSKQHWLHKTDTRLHLAAIYVKFQMTETTLMACRSSLSRQVSRTSR